MTQEQSLYTTLGRVQPKPEKPIRLTGKALDIQNQDVYIRDNGKCVLCGRTTVAPVHHIEHGSGNRSDEEKNKVIICNECHAVYHHGNLDGHVWLMDKILSYWGFKKFVQLFLKGYIAFIYEKK